MKQLNYDEATIWLAGLLEGEGYFGICNVRRPSRDRLVVVVEMTDRDVIERAAALHPSVKVFQRKRQASYKVTYQVKWNSKKAEEIMRRVLPYVGERRKQKIWECLAHPNLSHTTRPKEATAA